MKTVYALTIWTLGLFGTLTVRAQEPDYQQVVSQKLAPVLQKCVRHIEDKMAGFKGQDTFTFKIAPNGRAQGFKYVTENKISKTWLGCAEREVLKTQFPKTPGKKAYTHQGVMTWNMQVEEINPYHKTMTDHAEEFQNCYKDYTRDGGKKDGSVVMVWQVNSQNRASFAKLNVDEIQNKKFSECLLSTLRNIIFPVADTKETEVSFPFQFKYQP